MAARLGNDEKFNVLKDDWSLPSLQHFSEMFLYLLLILPPLERFLLCAYSIVVSLFLHFFTSIPSTSIFYIKNVFMPLVYTVDNNN